MTKQKAVELWFIMSSKYCHQNAGRGQYFFAWFLKQIKNSFGRGMVEKIC